MIRCVTAGSRAEMAKSNSRDELKLKLRAKGVTASENLTGGFFIICNEIGIISACPLPPLKYAVLSRGSMLHS